MNKKITFPFYHRSFATVDLDKIRQNFLSLKSCLEDDVLCCSVVKANAYGHGAIAVATVLEPLSDYFAVATMEEAVELRQNEVKKPILILGYTDPEQFDLLLQNDLTTAIYNLDEAKLLSKAAGDSGKIAKVHLAVDTGMGRIGVTPDEEGAEVARQIYQMPNIFIEGLFSHYAKADYADKSTANLQTEKFERFISLLEERSVEIPIKHILNSAGTMEMPKHFNMARFGIALYGLYPSEEVNKQKIKLEPAMNVFSHIVHVKTVHAGDGIGYGHEYIAQCDRKIATVAIGYADGFNRCLTNTGWVLIGGKKAKICGKVCMDQIMVDVSNIEDVQSGDIAVIIGKYADEEISAETFGSLTYSFNYEVVCTFMPRVKRYYFEHDKLIEK